MFKEFVEWISIHTRMLLNYVCPVDQQANSLIDGMIRDNIQNQERVKQNRIVLNGKKKPRKRSSRKGRKK